ncbi:hypothetical protein A8F94_00675 [Bacillus sp. FJAT-27225]|nr:hypothetical protein A8F94_00675 [Bacillus sp. FJAT-27225]
MKKIIVLFLVVLLSGCSFLNASKYNQIPGSGKIVVDQSEYEMIAGEYEWEGGKTKIKRIDPVSPIESAKDFDTLKVGKNKKIEIVIDDNPNLTVYQWTEDGVSKELTLTDNIVTVPSKSGYYIYEVVGKWPDGTASYIFDVEVK